MLETRYDKKSDETVEEYLSNSLASIATAIKCMMNSKDFELSCASILGRSIDRPETLFEIIISIPNITKSTEEDNIIVEVWKKFNLDQNPEILLMVSIYDEYVDINSDTPFKQKAPNLILDSTA